MFSASRFAPAHLFQLLNKHKALFLPYRGAIGGGVLALLLTNVFGLLIPLKMKAALEILQQLFGEGAQAGAHTSQWQALYVQLWITAALACVVLLCRVASRQFLLGAGRRLEYDLRNKLFQHLLKMPASYYAAHPSGELMSRLTNDVDATKYLTGGGIMLGVNTLLAYLLTIPLLLWLNWQLALVTFCLYPFVIWGMGSISKKVRQGFYDVQQILAKISTIGQENLSGMTVIQSYAREEAENKRFYTVCQAYYDRYTALIHERILLFMLLATLSGLSTFLVLSVGGWQVISKQLNWGGFVAFTLYLEHLAWPTMALGWTISIFQQGTAALERIDEVLSTEPSIASANLQDIETSPSFHGKIEVRDLTFAHHNPYTPRSNGASEPQANLPGPPVLKNVNFTIQSGETVAIVGSVGSGKSTLLRLLPRILEVPSGHVFLDGEDITQLDLQRLRQTIILMPQASFLFSTTVKKNLAFGHVPSTDDERDAEFPSLIEAAETARVHLDIEKLPERYDTVVGERGLLLSGGQRQRVALARTLVMDAKVLLLDDPFSNVDAETERQIVLALQARKAFHNKTTLVATHRFSVVNLCDRIILMDQGELLAIGTHQKLLATQPLYQKLHRLQELRSNLGEWELIDTPTQAETLEEEML